MNHRNYLLHWYKKRCAAVFASSFAHNAFSLAFFVLLNQSVRSQNITPGDTAICQGASVVLTANPAGNGYRWRNAGTIIPGATARTYTVTTAGTYDVIVTTGSVQDTLPAVTIMVNPKPVAFFTVVQSGICFSDPVQFTAVTAPGLTYLWDFGDPASGASNTSSSPVPSHRFIGAAGGGSQLFTVKLTVTNGFGCDSAITKQVTFPNEPSSKLSGTGFVSPNVFRNCTSTSATFTFLNQSTTTNTKYEFIWGDGQPSPPPFFPPFASTTHTYPTGDYVLKFIVTGANGCVDTGVYRVFVGTNPGGGMPPPVGGLTLCVGESVKFPVLGAANNTPGTTYTVTFSDDPSLVLNFNHPPPDTIQHTYTKTSCGSNSPGYSNSFFAKFIASNPCSNTSNTTEPIFVSNKPKAQLTVSPGDTVCVNTTVTFLSTSLGNVVTSQSCMPNKIVWKVNPLTGRSRTCGDYGTDSFDPLNPDLWIAGLNPLCLNYTLPGLDTIILKTGGACGGNSQVIDSVKKVICVNPIPTASFTASLDSGCAPFTITTSTTTNTPFCGSYKYRWTITYTNPAACVPAGRNIRYVAGTDSTSREPSIEFINPGTYTLALTVISPGGTCSTSVAPKIIKVKGKPNIGFVTNSLPAVICQNKCIDPRATYNCYVDGTSTYAWSFPGGTPDTSNAANPGTVCYATPGTYNISLKVKNVCGDSVIVKPITVTPATITPTASSNSPVCAGDTIKLFAGPIINGATYTWTGPVSYNDNRQNPTRPNATTSMSGWYKVTVAVNGCSSAADSVFVVVKPKPAKPVVCTVGPVNYCFNDPALPLCATASPDNTLFWCTAYAQGCGTTAIAPRTDTAATLCYTVYQQSDTSGCKSDTARICVTVAPKITNNLIKSDQTLCTTPSMPLPLTQLSGTVLGGTGSYNYQWQFNTTGSWGNVTGAILLSYSPGPLSVTTRYRRIVTSGICSDTSNTVTVTVGSLPPPAINASQIICAGAIPALLTGPPPPGNVVYTFAWESSASAAGPWAAVTGAALPSYQPPVLNATTYYRRKDSSGGCSAYSVPVKIAVYNRPSAGIIRPADTTVCVGSSVTVRATTSDPVLRWEYNPAPINDNIWLTVSSPIFTNVTQTFAVRLLVVTPGYGQGCDFSDTSSTAVINVSEKAAGGNTATDTTVCSGANAGAVTLTNQFGQIVRWESSVTAGAMWDTIPSNGSTLPYSNLTNTTWYRAVVKNGACPESFSDTTVITVVRSVTPAQAGSDTAMCNATSVVLNGNQPLIGKGEWKQLSGPVAVIVNPFSTGTLVNGLVPGNAYRFAWVISGNGLCAGSSDTVEIKTWPLTTVADAGNDTTICDFTSARTIQLHGSAARSFESSQWSLLSGPGGSTFGNSSNPLSAFTVSQPGRYRLRWRIWNAATGGCPQSEDSVIVAVYEKPVAGIVTPAAPTVCAGDSLTLSCIQLRGAVEKWQWAVLPLNPATWQDINISSPAYTFRNVQSAFAARVIVRMPNAWPDCLLADTSKPVTVTVNPVPPAAIKVSPSLVLQQPDYTFSFSDTLPANALYRYLWEMGDRSRQTRSGREITYTYGDTGTFTARLTVTDFGTDCKGYDSVRVKILYVPGYLYIPNAMCIGCNNNSLRRFLPLGKGLKDYRLRIFSKSGQLLFETTKLNPDGSPAEAWNGDFKNNSSPVEQNAFMWIAEGKFINDTEWKGMVYPPDKRYVKSGFITFVK